MVEAVRQRFWDKVVIGNWFACWDWTGAMSVKKGGYRRPVIWICRDPTTRKQLIVPAFRVALCLRDGTELWDHEGFEACHLPECDNEECVNPYHGYWGTPDENRRDRYAHLLPRDRRAGVIPMGGRDGLVVVERVAPPQGLRENRRRSS